MKLKTLIVDDEPLARERVRSLLTNDPEIQIIGDCGDGATAVQRIIDDAPDLVFLDVQMPELDGLSVVRAVPADKLPKIVFATAYDEFALAAFEANAVDYLLKPFKVDRFQQALGRAKAQITQQEVVSENERLRKALRANGGPAARLVIRTKSRVLVLRPDDVEFIQASANYITLHTNDGPITVREQISDFEDSAPPEFVRIHRSIVVNLNRVREVAACGPGESIVVVKSGRELPVGRSFREALDDRLQQLVTRA